MKRIAFFSCFFLLVALGLGCALTDYDLITDNDQVANGQGSGIVNTNGKAKITPSFQVAQRWPDGADELFWMVDQKANGDRTLTTYNNFSTGSDPIFHDDLYCNPDWSGCALVTALDPEEGDNPWDYSSNSNCSGFRTLTLLISSGRYYGECGRAAMNVSDRIAFMNMATIQSRNGVEGLLYNMNRSNLKIQLDNNAGVVSQLTMVGDLGMFIDVGHRRLEIDATNSLLKRVGYGLVDFSRDYGSEVTTVTFTLNGISRSWDFSTMGTERLLAAVNKRY